MKKHIYTIGYTAYPIRDFLSVLKNNRINCLIDVRSVPKSSYYVDYDSDNLKRVLKGANILYRNYKDEFGARQEDKSYYPNGYLDFGIFTNSQKFLSGVDKIDKAISMGYTVCLMCAEKDPINCHRAIMISRKLDELGFEVTHLLALEEKCSQKDIDNRLLDKYYPNRGQLSIFQEDNLSDEEAVRRCYIKQNKEIGFKLEDE